MKLAVPTFLALILVAVCPVAAQTSTQLPGIPFKAPIVTAPSFSASVVFSNLTTPRGITFDDEDNLLVVERGLGVSVFSALASGAYTRTVLIPNAGFTQGIQVFKSELYVSTASQALLYTYDPKTKVVANPTSPVVVVDGIPPDGDLTTHTLQFEHAGGVPTALLIASGPLTNIDPTASNPANGRSQIRRFALSSPPSNTTQQWANGQIIAFGIRNPAGFAFVHTSFSNTQKTLYVVENGASIDNVTRTSPPLKLSAQFVNDNPADEINLVTYPVPLVPAFQPKSYGFPDCTTLWNGSADPTADPEFVGMPRGSQFSLGVDPARGDAFCKNAVDNVPPVLSFQAHSVPLDIKFYHPKGISSRKGFPDSFKKDAFVSFHGSFDRTPPTGYGVVHVPFPFNQPPFGPLGYSFLVQAANLTSCPGKCIRPVGLAFAKDGRLFVSSDNSGELFVIESS